jgi:hypothetical protein
MAGRALGGATKAMFSERAFKVAEAELNRRPNSKLYDGSGLYLADRNAGISGCEEAFMSRLAERIPILGRAARAGLRRRLRGVPEPTAR